MPYLVLDLEETTFVIDRDINLQQIHGKHTIWNRINATLSQQFSCTIGIINPKQLLDLLKAASNSDGLIVLTAGYWEKEVMIDIINAIDDQYKVPKKVRTMIQEALFYSPQEEEKKYKESKGLTLYSQHIRLMSKSHRLQNIINMENLKGKEFVVLDNDYTHIKSFCEMKNVVAIRATTDTYNKSFYKIAIDALSNSYQPSQERQVAEKYQQAWQMFSNPAPKKPCIESIEPAEDIEFSSFIEELLADETSSLGNVPFILGTSPAKTIKEQVEDLSKSWPTQWSTDLEELSKLKEFTSYLIKNCEFKLKYSLIYNYFLLFQPTTSEKLKKIIELTDFPQRIQLIRELNETLALNIQLEEDRSKTIGNKAPNIIDNEGPLLSCHPQAARPLNTDSAKSVTHQKI